MHPAAELMLVHKPVVHDVAVYPFERVQDTHGLYFDM
jgi:hypothetical protein